MPRVCAVIALVMGLSSIAAAEDWSQFIDKNPSQPMKVTSQPLVVPTEKPAKAPAAKPAKVASKARPKARAKTKARHK